MKCWCGKVDIETAARPTRKRAVRVVHLPAVCYRVSPTGAPKMSLMPAMTKPTSPAARPCVS